LRRLLRLNSPTPSEPRKQNPEPPLPPEVRIRLGLQQTKDEILRDERKKVLWEFLKGPQFQSERNVVGKFLSLLAFLHRENRDRFGVVESISGRSRKYFAKSESDLKQSGNSVHPKDIPGSVYWVVTNNSTQSKRELVLQVLKLLGYDGGFSAFVATQIN
jgi:negative modulator of initiation of replication